MFVLPSKKEDLEITRKEKKKEKETQMTNVVPLHITNKIIYSVGNDRVPNSVTED